jgi:hypothetical protein
MLRAHIAVGAGAAKKRSRKTLECGELFR